MFVCVVVTIVIAVSLGLLYFLVVFLLFGTTLFLSTSQEIG